MRIKRSEPGSVYEDASTVDPSALNEALTATRPEDIAGVDVDAVYRDGDAPLTTDVTGVAEHSEPDPGYQTNGGPGLGVGANGGIDTTQVPEGSAVTTTERPAGQDGGTGEPESTPSIPPPPPAPGEVPEGHPVPEGETPSNEIPQGN